MPEFKQKNGRLKPPEPQFLFSLPLRVTTGHQGLVSEGSWLFRIELGGGFKYVVFFTPNLGELIHFD